MTQIEYQNACEFFQTGKEENVFTGKPFDFHVIVEERNKNSVLHRRQVFFPRHGENLNNLLLDLKCLAEECCLNFEILK